MDQIHDMLAKSRLYNPNNQEALNQFKTLFKFLAFVASAAKIPIGSNLFEETKKVVEKIGTAENIYTWSWTPQQLKIISSSESMKKVALCGGNGTGKTMILKEMAKARAQEGKRVVYIIFTWDRKMTLLYFQLKSEFKNTSIEIGLYDYFADSEKFIDLENAYIFIDEAVGLKNLEGLIMNNYFDKCSSVCMALGLKPEESKGLLSEFHIISLELSLRTTQKVTNLVKNEPKYFPQRLGNSMNESLKILPHMPLGKDVVTIRRTAGEPLIQVMKRAMDNVTPATKLLICLNDDFSLKKSEEILSCFYMAMQNRPLIFMHSKYNFENSKEEDIEKWVDNHPSMKGRALVADSTTVPGFEAEVVMGIGEFDTTDRNINIFISRARVQFIRVLVVSS